MDRQQIERALAKYPIYQFQFIKTDEIPFSEKVRDICKNECERYGSSWSCPPAVGTVEECRVRVQEYDHALVFSTVADTAHTYDFASLLKTRTSHEDISQELLDMLEKDNSPAMALSTESCALCRDCTYPDGKCRFPHHMHPCIESHGILVTALLEQLQMDYTLGEHQVLWFSILFFSESYNI